MIERESHAPERIFLRRSRLPEQVARFQRVVWPTWDSFSLQHCLASESRKDVGLASLAPALGRAAFFLFTSLCNFTAKGKALGNF
jgi:hypothetical protein